VVLQLEGRRLSWSERPGGPPLFRDEVELEADWGQLGDVLIAGALASQGWWAPDTASGELLEGVPGRRRVHLQQRNSVPLLAPRDALMLEGLWPASHGCSAGGCSQSGPVLAH
jgi:hypothetical protein